MFKPTPTWPNVDFKQLFMWIEQSHIWPFRLNITFGWLQKLTLPSLNIRSLPFVVFLGGFPIRCQNLSSGAIRPGGLLLFVNFLMQACFVSLRITNILLIQKYKIATCLCVIAGILKTANPRNKTSCHFFLLHRSCTNIILWPCHEIGDSCRHGNAPIQSREHQF